MFTEKMMRFHKNALLMRQYSVFKLLSRACPQLINAAIQMGGSWESD